ncbi:hypothetical protein JKP88DRAFT_244672 [Tribonema minus]|uniref:Kinesin motor domain-containing protein n=1 Tax=Tribonema minus TaxID=303371 RepID=A0A836CFK7_9STRA|nr:hypothetical protein JKP88DRAFT_244672 [Tribonema minus]
MASVAALTAELQAKEVELKTLQASFEDYVQSSKELEEELDNELVKAQQQISALNRQCSDLSERCETLQLSSRAAAADITRLQDTVAQLSETVAEAEASRTRLEQTNDQLETRVRQSEASEEALKHQLDAALEQRIFTQHDLEELQAEDRAEELQLSNDELNDELIELQHQLMAAPPQQQPSTGDASLTETGSRSAAGTQELAGTGHKPTLSDTGSVFGSGFGDQLGPRRSEALPPDDDDDAMEHDNVFSGTTARVRVQAAIAAADASVLAAELQLMCRRYEAERAASAALLAKLQTLRSGQGCQRHTVAKLQAITGNIAVLCRIRPPSAKELAASAAVAVEPLSISEVGLFDKRTREWRGIPLDKVLGGEMGQQDVFAEVEPLALSVADGYNAAIMCFGQTGSGKTWTMAALCMSGSASEQPAQCRHCIALTAVLHCYC